jgi:hypothetical protein
MISKNNDLHLFITITFIIANNLAGLFEKF